MRALVKRQGHKKLKKGRQIVFFFVLWIWACALAWEEEEGVILGGEGFELVGEEKSGPTRSRTKTFSPPLPSSIPAWFLRKGLKKPRFCEKKKTEGERECTPAFSSKRSLAQKKVGLGCKKGKETSRSFPGPPFFIAQFPLSARPGKIIDAPFLQPTQYTIAISSQGGNEGGGGGKGSAIASRAYLSHFPSLPPSLCGKGETEEEEEEGGEARPLAPGKTFFLMQQ